MTTANRLNKISDEQLNIQSQYETTDLGTLHTEKDAINAGMILKFGTTKLRKIKKPTYGKSRFFARIRVHHAITFNLDLWGRIYFLRKHI